MEPAAGQEQRKFYRHPLTVPIQYQEFSAREHAKSSTLDVSEGGLSFVSERFLAVGRKIHLTIPVGDQLFRISGKVAYCNQIAHVDSFRTGISFLDMEDAFRAKLAEEMLLIEEYKKKLSEELGRPISAEEAANEWIKKYARQFSYLF